MADHNVAENSDDQVFCELSADEKDAAPIEIESLCVKCEENGITRILCTRIPFYRQVIVMSFYCNHCGYTNNELQSGEAAQEHGIDITLHVNNLSDLNRMVVKSEYAEVEIKELELNIPPKSQSGEVTTVEGIVRRVITGLSQDQDRRRQFDPENAEKISEFLKRMERLEKLEEKFTLRIRDVSGNSFIQNSNLHRLDNQCIVTRFRRSIADEKLLGLVDDNENEEVSVPFHSYDDVKNEVLRFDTNCPNCGFRTQTCMKPTVCDACGWKSNEVKDGGAIQEYGCKLTVFIEKEVDLTRDVLKSSACCMVIPELDLEVGCGALSGRFTTVEGLIVAIKDQLKEQASFFLGDSNSEAEIEQMSKFLENFDQILRLEKKVHLVLDDPTGNSYIQSFNAPINDSGLKKEFYKRSKEQNDELGFNDMKTENYEQLESLKEEEN